MLINVQSCIIKYMHAHYLNMTLTFDLEKKGSLNSIKLSAAVDYGNQNQTLSQKTMKTFF